MTRILSTVAVALLVGFVAPATAADQRVGHFKGKPAATLDQALTNFSEYNARLADIMRKSAIDGRDLAAIHELSYTLEIALQKIRDELGALADTLEALHIASETANVDGARKSGEAYLDTARRIRP